MSDRTFRDTDDALAFLVNECSAFLPHTDADQEAAAAYLRSELERKEAVVEAADRLAKALMRGVMPEHVAEALVPLREAQHDLAALDQQEDTP